MNIIPKSEAELVSQFLSIPPDDLELGHLNNSRYMHAYNEIGMRMESADPDTGTALREIAEADNDILADNTPYDLSKNIIKKSTNYLTGLKKARLKSENKFRGVLNGAVRVSGDVNPQVVENRIAYLQDNTLHFGDRILDQEQQVSVLFPSGNYFLHATETASILEILKDGKIRATVGFDEKDRMDRTNGGSFGVSGNYNNVANILGTFGHLAGFIADPQTVLENQNGYFAPSSKTCWDELQYLPSNEDPLHIMRIRDAETHIEEAAAALQQAMICYEAMSGNPEVLASIPPDAVYQMQYGFSASMKLQESNPDLLTRSYRTTAKGDFRFTEMMGHDGENVSPLSVIVGAGLEGAFGSEVAELLQQHGGNKLDLRLFEILEPIYTHLSEQTDLLYKSVASEVGSTSAIQVENTLFYCPEKDYKKWLDVIARMPHQPRGIVTYVSREVRTPAAFALALPDNGGPSLSNQLSAVKSDKTINWLDIFDEPPKQKQNNHFLIQPREANLAGVLTLDNNGSLVVRSLDDLDDDD